MNFEKRMEGALSAMLICFPIGGVLGTVFVNALPEPTQEIRQAVWGDRASPVSPESMQVGQYAGSGVWRNE